MQKHSTNNRHIRGFNMVEVLVALVVLSVGMLGIAGLYVTTLRSGSSAIARTQAVSFAADLADRIRANRNRGNGPGFNDTQNYDTAVAVPSNQNCVGGATVCSTQQIANEDLFTLQQQIVQALPGNPTVTVTRLGGTAPFTYTITITWQEPGEATPLSHVLVTEI